MIKAKKNKQEGYRAYLKKKKRAKRRIKKTILKNRYFWLFFIGILFLCGLIYFLFFSKVFEIKTITVQGSKLIDNSEIELFTREGAKNIFLFPKQKTEKIILEKFLTVEEVVIKRELPSKLKILIIERKALILFCQKENCFFTDKNGLLFFHAEKMLTENNQDVRLPIIVSHSEQEFFLGNNAVEPETVSFIFDLSNIMGQYPKIKINHFLVDFPKITAIVEKDWEIYFSQEKDLKTQTQNLILLLENEIFSEKEKNDLEKHNLEYINLMFSKIFYKYKD